jgi:quinolinate synthase
MNLPMAPSPTAPAEDIPALSEEVRALAQERGAIILAHNYQVPEVQDVADYVGDSLGLSRQGAATDAEIIAFCGVHFMA